MQYNHIVPAVFLSRPNRFTAVCQGPDGRELRCHLRNTGRCAELLLPGARVWLQHTPSPTRKTQYTLITVEKQGRLVNLDSLAPNRLFTEGIDSGKICLPGLGEVSAIRPEVRAGDSRLDFRLDSAGAAAYCEVKGVTLEQDGVALFPDAPTVRGLRHIRELTALHSQGFLAAAVFVVQMEEACCFRPNTAAQPDFHQALFQAREQGVQVLAYNCRVCPDSVELLAPLEVQL